MPAVFTLFPRLPLELRLLIWEHCIPNRVVELERPHEDNILSNCRLTWSARQNARPPIITRVCHESRSVALRTGHSISYDDSLGIGIGGMWFDSRHDTVAWYWDSSQWISFGWPTEDTNDVMEYFMHHVSRTQTQQALIMADRIYAFNYFNEPPKPHTGHLGVKDVAEISQWKDYMVCLKMISIHMNPEQALKSDLFGLTGEQLVQVVDPTDKSRIVKYSNECHPEDQKARQFFQLALDSAKLDAALAEWRKNIVTQWIWSKWMHVWHDNFSGISHPEDIWLGPRTDDQGQPLDLLRPSTFCSKPPLPRTFLVNLYSPNENHPWVKKGLAEIPRFQPVFVFRLCVMRCYKIPQVDAPEMIGEPSMEDIVSGDFLRRTTENPLRRKQRHEKWEAEKEEWKRSAPDRRIMERR